jgi:twitching motility two-component system response regulator PilG
MSNCKVLVMDDSNTIRPHVIFCDILMPRLDGYQTCAIIKRNPKFMATPVVMLSSKDGVFDKARGRMVGSQEYLTKPFTKDQLLSAVTQLRVTAHEHIQE